MSFRPIDFSPLVQMALQERERKRNEMLQLQQLKAQRDQREFQTGLQLLEATEGDIDLNRFDLGLHARTQLREIQGSLKKRKKRAEAEKNLPALAAMAASGQTGPNATATSGPPSAYQQGLEALAGFPGLQQDLQTRIQLEQLRGQGRLPEQTGQEAIVKRAEARGRAQELSDRDRLALIDRLGNDFLQQDQTSSELPASTISEIVDQEADLLVATGRFSDRKKARDLAQSLVIEGLNRRDALVREVTSVAAGTQGDVRTVDLLMQQITEDRFPIWASTLTPKEKAKLRRNVELSVSDRATELPAISQIVGRPVFVSAQDTQEAKKTREAARAQVELGGALELARQDWKRLQQAHDEGRLTSPLPAGPITGLDFFQAIAQAFGVQDPEARSYRNTSFFFISRLLKATQGSRPSDFDLRMYMALLPSLTEILSPAGEAAFSSMQRMMDLQIQSYTDKDLAREIEQKRSIPKTAEERRLEGILLRMNDPELSDGEKAQLMTEFLKGADAWKRSERAKQFQLKGVKLDTPQMTGDPKTDSLIEELGYY